MFLASSFLTIHESVVLIDSFINSLNPQTKIDYLIKREKQCPIFDYLLNSQNLLCVRQKNVEQKLMHTWRPIVSFHMKQCLRHALCTVYCLVIDSLQSNYSSHSEYFSK